MNPSRLRIVIVVLIVSSFACNLPSQVTPTPARTLIADYGDAPDPNFPSLLASRGAHTLDITQFWLGSTQEPSATTEPDAKIIDRDELDDGLERVIAQGSALALTFRAVKSRNANGGIVYFNLLADLNADGRWQGQNEWVTINREIQLAPGASEIIESRLASAPKNFWIRATLTDKPVDAAAFPNGWDGTGEFAKGEVEDYRFPFTIVPPPTDTTPPPYTPTLTPTRFITSLPPRTPTPTPTRFITSLAVRTNTPTKLPPIEILSLELQPSQPTLGQTVFFTGAGFTPNGSVTKTFIRPDGYSFGFQTQANAQGVVTGSLEITKDQPTGVWTVIATDEATKRQVRTTFNVSH
jgi:hypothetical protein